MIPRTINQIWIGDIYEPPTHLMDKWKAVAAEMDNVSYILWTEDEIRKRGVVLDGPLIAAIENMPEINGKADILRWELLRRFGGIFVDADSIPVAPLIEDFFTPMVAGVEVMEVGFAAFENEQVRPNLVATGTMGFTAGHPLVEDIVAWLRTDSSHPLLRSDKAWRTVGPGCITRFLDSGKYADNMVIFPSHYFIPIHYCSEAQPYIGHQKVYAHQFWGTGECKYQPKNGGRDGDILLSSEIPPELILTSQENITTVSVLVNSYNTPKKWIHECLQSIQNQKGVFAFELIWIDDGSETELSTGLIQELQWFERTTRFLVAVKYHKMPTNVGTRRAIDYGISLCANELIIKMDADDLMISTRIKKQIDFMENNPQVVCCGGQLMQFKTNDETGQKVRSRITNHPLTITEDHCQYWEWFMNHPTLCYRKWAILEIGGYGIGANLGEDRELEVRLLQHFGNGSLCNIDDILLLYRLHSGGISQNGII